jgi:histidinol-phosphate aminotransferase
MENLVNTNVLDLIKYTAGLPVEEIKRKYNLKKVIKLASNENPFPISQIVSEAINKENSEIGRYPDTDSFYLKKKISQYNNVEMENVIVGAGSVEIIRMIIKAFLKPGEKVLTSENTFIFYKIATIETGGKHAYVQAKMDEHHRFDLDNINQLIDDETKIIFLTNPNNPTGTILPKEKMLEFIKKVPEDIIVVLDNAYQEYVMNQEDYLDGVDLALSRKNIIVLRTFSKVYGLAGLRVGYGISNEEIISWLNRLKAPFNVTRVAQAAALASLENDDYKKDSAKLNQENKDRLYQQLKDTGVKVVPSETNFLLFYPEVDVTELNEGLLKEGVIIRPMGAFGIPNGMRVTVGTREDNDYFIEKFKKVLQQMKQ